MRIIRDEMLQLFDFEAEIRKKAIKHLGELPQARKEFQGMVMDLEISKQIALRAETIIFSSDVMMQLMQNIDKIDYNREFLLPYPNLIIQFTHKIPEKDLMVYEEVNEWQRINHQTEDWIEAILLSNPNQEPELKDELQGRGKRNAILWYTSTSMNRIAWDVRGGVLSQLTYAPGVANTLGYIEKANKKRLMQIAYLLEMFLNAPNVLVERQKPPKALQDKRAKEKKPLLSEYHTVTIQKTFTEIKDSGKQGRSHTYLYPVRGHFRKLKQFAKPIWIPNHFRGLAHGLNTVKKEVYKVKTSKK